MIFVPSVRRENGTEKLLESWKNQKGEIAVDKYSTLQSRKRAVVRDAARATMSPAKALRMQARIYESARKLRLAGVELHKLVLEFRKSGAWACTPEHHASFGEWARFFAPKLGMAGTTLNSYGNPNYEDRYTRLLRKNNWQPIQSLNISGQVAKILRKAIDRAHEIGIKEGRRGGTERAITAIAKFYLAKTEVPIIERKVA